MLQREIAGPPSVCRYAVRVQGKLGADSQSSLVGQAACSERAEGTLRQGALLMSLLTGVNAAAAKSAVGARPALAKDGPRCGSFRREQRNNDLNCAPVQWQSQMHWLRNGNATTAEIGKRGTEQGAFNVTALWLQGTSTHKYSWHTKPAGR